MKTMWIPILMVGLGSSSIRVEAGSERLRPAGAPRLSTEEPRWRGPDGTVLPFSRDEEILEFLRTATVIKKKQLDVGKNRSLKVRLEKDGVQANAIFRTVSEHRSYARLDGRTYREFIDSYLNECAAYEVSLALEIDNVPPCVPRNMEGKPGTLQLWIEEATTFEHLAEENPRVIATRQWSRQRQMMRIFDALIYNFDRNQGNMLYDSRGKLWFIDHTRSFLPMGEIQNLDQIVWCERSFFERIKGLEVKSLSRHLSAYLDYRQILALMTRRDRLVERIEDLIGDRGEAAVLLETPETSEGTPFF